MATYEVCIQPELIAFIFLALGMIAGIVTGRILERDDHAKVPIGTLVIDRHYDKPEIYLQLTADIESFENEREVRLRIISFKNRQKRSRR